MRTIRTLPVDGPAPKTFKSCKKICPGGNECKCNEDVDHVLHICTDPRCYCHSRERYERDVPTKPHTIAA